MLMDDVADRMKAFNDVLDPRTRRACTPTTICRSASPIQLVAIAPRRHADRRLAGGHGRGRRQRAARSAGGDAESIEFCRTAAILFALMDAAKT
jgi:hypothetical protein